MENNSIVIAYCRCQPPTKGHEHLFSEIINRAKEENSEHLIFLSPTMGKNNPLHPWSKAAFLVNLFPEMHFYLDIPNPFDAICQCGKLGFEKVTIFAGSDRIPKYQSFVKYINHTDPTKRIPFVKELIIETAGMRTGEGIASISASKARQAVIDQNREQFKLFLPTRCSDEISEEIYNSVERGILNEFNRVEPHRS